MAGGLGNTKYEFGRHLSHIGFELGKPREAVLQELRTLMGHDRHREFTRLSKENAGEEGQNRVYDFMQDMREANVFRSACLDATLDTSYYLYENGQRLLSAGKRIIELGCWTGGLASFIAEHHPDCTVVGVDRAKRIIEVDQGFYDLPNLAFMVWDYRKAKPEALEPADVLLCGLGTNNDVAPDAHVTDDPRAVRQSEGYNQERRDVSSYLQSWRQAAKPAASLIAVIRVLTFPRFLAFMDAASENGWMPLFDRFTFVTIPSNGERIPALQFKAEPTQPFDEDLVLSHWMRLTAGTDQILQILGSAALGVYRVLSDRQVLTRRDGRDTFGLAVKEELGICGCFGYVFAHCARPEYRLTLMTVEKVKRLAQGQPPAAVIPPQQQWIVSSCCSVGMNWDSAAMYPDPASAKRG